MDKRHSVRCTVLEVGLYDEDFPEDLTGFIAMLTDVMAKIPAEFLDTASIELQSDYDTSSVDIEVFYKRPETDVEFNDRIARQAEYERSLAEDQKARELRVYHQLRAKYG